MTALKGVTVVCVRGEGGGGGGGEREGGEVKWLFGSHTMRERDVSEGVFWVGMGRGGAVSA